MHTRPMDSAELQNAQETFRRHLEQPHITAAAYLWNAIDDLGQQMRSRRRVYLDTNFWVHLRNAAMNRATKPIHTDLFRTLEQLVGEGRVICPVSDVAFVELTQQTDEQTRLATARLWDQLSLGCALQSEKMRVSIELEEFLKHGVIGTAKARFSDRMLVRPCYVLGPVVPSSPEIPAEVNRALQKSVIERLWSMSFVEMTRDSSAHLLMKEKFEETASRINRDMRRPENRAASFERAFNAEIVGVLDVSADLLRHALISAAKNHSALEPTTRELDSACETTRRMIYNVFRLRRDRVALLLPTMYMQAACHAAIRMDDQRKFNGNFLRDLHHGTAGVTYHDLMLTERPLAVLLKSGKVTADTRFGCAVISDESEALEWLRAMD